MYYMTSGSSSDKKETTKPKAEEKKEAPKPVKKVPTKKECSELKE
jgi:hypothetical protein